MQCNARNECKKVRNRCKNWLNERTHEVYATDAADAKKYASNHAGNVTNAKSSLRNKANRRAADGQNAQVWKQSGVCACVAFVASFYARCVAYVACIALDRNHVDLQRRRGWKKYSRGRELQFPDRYYKFPQYSHRADNNCLNFNSAAIF